MHWSLRLLGFGAIAAVGVSSGGPAAQAASLCSEAKAIVQADREIGDATKLALQTSGALADNECLYPAKLMRFGPFDVLVTLAGAPGKLCHGCAAQMSACVFRRRPDGLALVSRFANFGEAGTNGDPGKIDQIQIAGSNGFAVEHGGTFQGYTASRLDFYVFKNGKLAHLKPTLELSADNQGAVDAPGKAVTVAASWALGGEASKQVTIDYKVTKGGRTSESRATWQIEKSIMSLKSGSVPPEYAEASGNGG